MTPNTADGVVISIAYGGAAARCAGITNLKIMLSRRAVRFAAWFTAFALVAVASLYALARWDANRHRSLFAFCKEAKAGLSIDDFFALEKRFGIDDTFVVGSGMSGYAGQRSTKDLEFRSQPMDPDFACAVDHDGRVITNVQLLTLEGFDPGQ